MRAVTSSQMTRPRISGSDIMAWILPVSRRSVSCVSAPTPPNCVSASSTKISTLDSALRTRRSRSKITSVWPNHWLRMFFSDEHDHVEFRGEGLEDVGLAAADRAAHRRAGQGLGTAGGQARHHFVLQECLEAAEADDVLEAVRRLLELDDVLAELALDELLDLGDDVVLRQSSLLVHRALEELQQGVQGKAGGGLGQLLLRAPELHLRLAGLAAIEPRDEMAAGRFVRRGDLDLEQLRAAGRSDGAAGCATRRAAPPSRRR